MIVWKVQVRVCNKESFGLNCNKWSANEGNVIGHFMTFPGIVLPAVMPSDSKAELVAAYFTLRIVTVGCPYWGDFPFQSVVFHRLKDSV